jgi:hypothetical protein
MFMGELYFSLLNLSPVDRGIWGWYNERAVCHKMVQRVNGLL